MVALLGAPSGKLALCLLPMAAHNYRNGILCCVQLETNGGPYIYQLVINWLSTGYQLVIKVVLDFSCVGLAPHLSTIV
jgi:hypothetical protein